MNIFPTLFFCFLSNIGFPSSGDIFCYGGTWTFIENFIEAIYVLLALSPCILAGNNVPFMHDSDNKLRRQPGNVSGSSTPVSDILTDEEDVFSKMELSKSSRKYQLGLSSSDAEIDYRRGRSLREGRGGFAWHH